MVGNDRDALEAVLGEEPADFVDVLARHVPGADELDGNLSQVLPRLPRMTEYFVSFPSSSRGQSTVEEAICQEN